MYKKFVKPIFDRIVALILIIIFSPLMLIIAGLIYIFDGKPVIFKQKRPGYKEKIFTIYKFRTMKNIEIEDEKRVTKLGKIIRRFKLDELPQLFNVLKGEMSLVGPRPLLVEYLDLYNTNQKRRHEVLPGITGLAQVMGGNDLSWEKRFEYDLYYVENISLFLDLKILILTFFRMFKSSKNISEKFSGN
jgi:undecaprenyl phosphate N,N'-diacetylbacillosamine 1-phosphate transferase